jgi:hypothetical protein
VDSHRLEGAFVAAISKIDPDAKKRTPIFQRNAVAAKKQAIRDAAEALGALWMPNRSKPFGGKATPVLSQ